MNTNQNDNSGQGNRDSQNRNHDSQRNQSGEQYGGTESRRFNNDDLEREDQRLTGNTNENSDSRNENDNEDRRMGERDFNSGTARNQNEEEEDLHLTGNSEEDRRASDSRNYGGSPDESESYRTSDREEEHDADRLASTHDFDEDDDRTEDNLDKDRPL